jgi:hypothetical protein
VLLFQNFSHISIYVYHTNTKYMYKGHLPRPETLIYPQSPSNKQPVYHLPPSTSRLFASPPYFDLNRHVPDGGKGVVAAVQHPVVLPRLGQEVSDLVSVNLRHPSVCHIATGRDTGRGPDIPVINPASLADPVRGRSRGSSPSPSTLVRGSLATVQDTRASSDRGARADSEDILDFRVHGFDEGNFFGHGLAGAAAAGDDEDVDVAFGFCDGHGGHDMAWHGWHGCCWDGWDGGCGLVAGRLILMLRHILMPCTLMSSFMDALALLPSTNVHGAHVMTARFVHIAHIAAVTGKVVGEGDSGHNRLSKVPMAHVHSSLGRRAHGVERLGKDGDLHGEFEEEGERVEDVHGAEDVERLVEGEDDEAEVHGEAGDVGDVGLLGSGHSGGSCQERHESRDTHGEDVEGGSW